MNIIHTTASALLSILAFTNPETTPKIAFDKDEYAQPLIDKLIECIGGRDGSQRVQLRFNEDEKELKNQFNGICGAIENIMGQLGNGSS